MQEGKLLMDEVISEYETRLGTLRTGRANSSVLYGVNIEYYGTPTPLDQIAQISISEGTQIVIKPFDPSSLKDIEKAINESSHINLLAQNDGTNIRINVPALSEETRREEAKHVAGFSEECKVQIRNLRRDLNDEVKANDLPEDDEKRELEAVQTLTDSYIKKIDAIAKAKVEEIMTV